MKGKVFGVPDMYIFYKYKCIYVIALIQGQNNVISSFMFAVFWCDWQTAKLFNS